MNSAVDFAYERFGKFVAPPGSNGFRDRGKLGWMKTPGCLLKKSEMGKRGAGDRAPSMDQAVIYISESEVRVYGREYAASGFPASGERADGFAFIERKWFEVPSEDWLAVTFGKHGVFVWDLVLNRRGFARTAYYDDRARALRYAYPNVLKAVGERLSAVKIKGVRGPEHILELCAKDLGGDLTGSMEKQQLLAVAAKVPGVMNIARRFFACPSPMEPWLVAQYMKVMSSRLESQESTHAV